MRTILFGSFSCLLAFLCASSTRAQDSACLRREVPVSFSDNKSNPIVEAQAQNLRAEIHGNSAHIVSLSPPDHSHRMVLLIDASGSMLAKWAIATSLAEHLAEERPSLISLALYVYGDKAGDQVEFSDGSDQVLRHLRSIQSDPSYPDKHVHGLTPTNDAVLKALKMFGTPQPGDAIFLITDGGGDNASHNGTAAVLSALIAHGVRLISCVFPDPVMKPAEMTPTDPLALSSAQTGGFVFQPWHNAMSVISPSVQPGLFSRLIPINPQAATLLYEQITESQILEMELPQHATKEESWKLEFSDVAPPHKNVFIYYPHKIAACVIGNEMPR
jgi:von Willebrand factor type A domain